MLQALKEVHPKFDAVTLRSISLRYIDAVPLNESESVLGFLKDKLHIAVSLPSSLFDQQQIEPNPRLIDSRFAFDCSNPRGLVTLRIVNGELNNQPAIVWETEVQSAGADLPGYEKLTDWLELAHNITHKWFFALIEGDLHQKFLGDSHA